MERHGYEVVAETDNGVDALQLAREHMPDIVILDIGIPKLDGLEVICRLSSTKQANPFKVLVLTSQAPGHFSMRCMQAGAAGYVCKQQDLTELLSAIKAVLSGYSYFPNQALNSVRSTMGNFLVGPAPGQLLQNHHFPAGQALDHIGLAGIAHGGAYRVERLVREVAVA